MTSMSEPAAGGAARAAPAWTATGARRSWRPSARAMRAPGRVPQRWRAPPAPALLRRRADALDAGLAAAVPDGSCRRAGRDADATSTASALADFCLGDTGSMFGHSPPAVVRAIAAQTGHGLTYMLPTEHAFAVGAPAARALRAAALADRNDRDRREPLRAARRAGGHRPRKILVMNGCYHGAVDETFVELRRRQGASTGRG